MSTLKSLRKPVGFSPGGGGGIKSELIFIHEDDISILPQRDVANPSLITTDIELKDGKRAASIYFTEKTIVPKQELVKGENADCGGFKISLEGFHPGLEQEVLDWLASNAFGFKGVILVRNCASQKVYLMGEPCNNMTIASAVTEWGATSENKKGTTITLEAVQSMPLALYSGKLPDVDGLEEKPEVI